MSDASSPAVVGHNRLNALAADIQAAHADVGRSALHTAERALAAGRMLNEAKAALAHGEWAGWLAEKVGIPARTANRYMALARSGLEPATVADLGIKGTAGKLARMRVPRPALGHYTEAAFQRETVAIVWRAPDQPDRFHVVVLGRIEGQDHRIAATNHPVPDEMLTATVVECGFPLGAAPFVTRRFRDDAEAGRPAPTLFREMALGGAS